MSQGKVYSYGSIEVTVAQGDKIAIFTEGTAQIYYKQPYSNSVSDFYYSSSVINQETVLGTFATEIQVRIDADEAGAIYATGTTPVIAEKIGDSLQGAGTATAVNGIAGTVGTGTTAGGAGGATSLTSGVGGAKTGTGAASGGVGGAGSLTAGAGGATASAGTDAGGAGGDVAITAGVGGAASAGTGNGGAGGTLTLAPGTGGTSAGGIAGIPGMVKIGGTAGGAAFAFNVVRSTITNTATLTDAQHRGMVLFQDASGGSVTMVTRTGTQLSAAFPDLAVGNAIPQYVSSNHASNTSTISVGTDVTLVGSGAVTQLGGSFLLIKTAATTFDLVRVG